MTVEKLNFEYQETDRPGITFYRPGLDKLDRALGNDGHPMIWEDIAIQPWILQGNRQESAIGTVQPPAERGIYISAGEICSDAYGIPKYSHTLDYHGPIEKLGYWLSLAENFRQDLLNMLYDEKGGIRPEMAKYVAFLKSKGLTPSEITAYGVEDLSPKNARAVTYHHPGTAAIGLDKRYYTAGKKELLGTSDKTLVELLKQDDVRHELVHVFGVTYENISKAGAEKTVALLMAEFYESRAEALKGTKQAKVYSALAEEARAYAERFSWYNRLIDGLKRDVRSGMVDSSEGVESLVEQYAKEAVSEGCTSEREVADYVSAKLESSEYAANKKAGAGKKEEHKEAKKDNNQDTEAEDAEDSSESQESQESSEGERAE